MPGTNVLKLAQPGKFTDLLTGVLRNGARRLLVQIAGSFGDRTAIARAAMLETFGGGFQAPPRASP